MHRRYIQLPYLNFVANSLLPKHKIIVCFKMVRLIIIILWTDTNSTKPKGPCGIWTSNFLVVQFTTLAIYCSWCWLCFV